MTPLYFDTASTSYPKPHSVRDLLAHFFDEPVGSYGRSGDERTLGFIAEVENLRDELAQLIGANEPDAGSHIIFTKNATEAINMVLHGIPELRRDRVLISPMEHNAVTRPLYHLAGEMYTVMPSDGSGRIDLETLEKLLVESKEGFDLVVINGMSNVNGVIPPLSEVCPLIHHHLPWCKILLDGAQMLPYYPVNVSSLGIDYVAMTGHKGFGGLQGTGALYLHDAHTLSPLIRGGNGTRSEVQEDLDLLPDRFEAGTLNLLGLVAWSRAMRETPKFAVSDEDYTRWLDELYTLPSLRIYSGENRLFSITSSRCSVAHLHDELLYRHGIITRAGIHCAPLAHRTLGTLPEGTVRIAPPPSTSLDELEQLTRALHTILR